MDQNDVRKFCDEFVHLSAFDKIKEIAPLLVAANQHLKT